MMVTWYGPVAGEQASRMPHPILSKPWYKFSQLGYVKASLQYMDELQWNMLKKNLKRCTLVSEYMGIPANINGQSLKSIGNP